MRSVVRALSLLAAPLHVHLLKALEPGPLGLAELHRTVGSPPQSTLRVYLRTLTELGVVHRRQQLQFPGAVEYELTRSGEKLLAVGEVLQRWLSEAPDGPILLGSTAAKSTTKALVDGWSAQIVRALAARPLALTDLSRVINGINYPTLERRLAAMRTTGLIQPCANRNGRAVPYEATPWMRAAVAPAAAAACWERRHAADHVPTIARTDIEAVLLLAVPLLELPADISGSCRLSVELRKEGELAFAGAMVGVEEGKVTSCVSRLEGQPEAWATGTVFDWSRWITHHEREVEVGGDVELAEAIADGLRDALLEREPLYD